MRSSVPSEILRYHRVCMPGLFLPDTEVRTGSGSDSESGVWHWIYFARGARCFWRGLVSLSVTLANHVPRLALDEGISGRK